MAAEHIKQFVTSQKWGTILVELVVLVVGILLAFQIDRWSEERRDAQLEREYLDRLRADLVEERRLFQNAAETANRRVTSVQRLDAVARNPNIAAQNPMGFAMDLETVGWISFPVISRFVYKELQNSGNLTLLNSQSLRRALARHYAELDHDERFGLDRQLLSRFSRITEGVLTTEQLLAIEEGADTGKITPAEALKMAEAFRSRNQAIYMLPELAQYHVFNRNMSVGGADSADKLVKMIEHMLKGQPTQGAVAWEDN